LKQVIEGTAALRGKSYPEIAAYLAEQPTVANPVKAAPQVPRRITMLEVFQAVATAAPADLAKAGQIPGWLIDRAEAMMAANDRAGMANYLTTIAAVAQLGVASQQALTALLTATEPDPTWAAQIPGSPRWQAAGLAAAPTAADVQAAVHGGG
jgi:hypothetical protein